MQDNSKFHIRKIAFTKKQFTFASNEHYTKKTGPPFYLLFTCCICFSAIHLVELFNGEIKQ